VGGGNKELTEDEEVEDVAIAASSSSRCVGACGLREGLLSIVKEMREGLGCVEEEEDDEDDDGEEEESTRRLLISISEAEE
jgi:hypothetical protein